MEGDATPGKFSISQKESLGFWWVWYGWRLRLYIYISAVCCESRVQFSRRTVEIHQKRLLVIGWCLVFPCFCWYHFFPLFHQHQLRGCHYHNHCGKFWLIWMFVMWSDISFVICCPYFRWVARSLHVAICAARRLTMMQSPNSGHRWRRLCGWCSGCIVGSWIARWWFPAFFISPLPGEWSNLTNIFQMGWNHHLDSNVAKYSQLGCFSKQQMLFCRWDNVGTKTTFMVARQRWIQTAIVTFIFSWKEGPQWSFLLDMGWPLKQKVNDLK